MHDIYDTKENECQNGNNNNNNKAATKKSSLRNNKKSCCHLKPILVHWKYIYLHWKFFYMNVWCDACDRGKKAHKWSSSSIEYMQQTTFCSLCLFIRPPNECQFQLINVCRIRWKINIYLTPSKRTMIFDGNIYHMTTAVYAFSSCCCCCFFINLPSISITHWMLLTYLLSDTKKSTGIG